MSMFPTRRAGFSAYPDNLDKQDQQTYQRWMRGLFVFYSIVIAAMVAANFAYLPVRDLTASIGSTKHLAPENAARSNLGTNATAEKK
jgi:hypothetical protein